MRVLQIKKRRLFHSKIAWFSWQVLEFLMIFWKSSMFWNASWCFQKAPFPSNCAEDVRNTYRSHQICLGELFSCTRLCKGMLKRRLLVFKKSSKLWHFSWKSCYFQMKKAPFWKWCFVWSNRCWKCIYHVCSFLAIYFQSSAIKSNLFWCSFFPYYDV